ncbi:MAG: thymidylate kinase [Candidatus Parcubacteria bacterium]|nr:dTMP kinase [Patescibacteria group bacterium]BCX16247.1 MAG: thymidylate kinase [Candidatus Parcubacteria bacterium]
MVTERNFVVFEGIDGSGKGTQIEMLKDYFQKRQRTNVVFTFEHTRESHWSQKIDEILSGKITDFSLRDLQLLYILDRKEHIEKFIKPQLKKGNLVFCDRYFLSTLAYGSLDKSLHWKTLFDYHKQIIGKDFILPAKTLFFDVSPDIALGRIEKRGEEKTYFETLERQRLVREAYLNIGRHFQGFEIIDGNGTPQEVFEKTKVSLAEYL